jgi:hypothetical protein
MSTNILLLYISWVFPYTTKKIKICGGPQDSVKIRSSSWSAKVCPGRLYMHIYMLYEYSKPPGLQDKAKS